MARRRSRRNPAEVPHEKTYARYRSAHWGKEPDGYFVVEDPDLPDQLVEMGKLVELELSRGPRGRSMRLEFGDGHNGDMLVFCQRRPERLFNVLLPETEAEMRKLFDAKTAIPLRTLAETCRRDARGGREPRQLRHPYPRVQVTPLGVVDSVTYATDKEGDGWSHYMHECGEESGIKPRLGVDREGRLWWAGGNYHVPDAGITD